MDPTSRLIHEMKQQYESSSEVLLRLQGKIRFRSRRRNRLTRLLFRTDDTWQLFLFELSKFRRLELCARFWNGLNHRQQTELVQALHRLEELHLKHISSPDDPNFMLRISIDHFSKLLRQNPCLQKIFATPDVIITDSGNGDHVELMFPPSLRKFAFGGHLEVENIRFHNLVQCIDLERLDLTPKSSIAPIESLLTKSEIVNIIRSLPRLHDIALYTQYWESVADVILETNRQLIRLCLRSTTVADKRQYQSIARLISSSPPPYVVLITLDEMDPQGIDKIANALLQIEGQIVSPIDFVVNILDSNLSIPNAIYDDLSQVLQKHYDLNVAIAQVGVLPTNLHEDPQASIIFQNRMNELGRGYLYAHANNYPLWIKSLATMNQYDDDEKEDSATQTVPLFIQCWLRLHFNPQTLNLSCVFELLRHNPNLIIKAASACKP